MKKVFLYLCLAAGLMSCAKEMTPVKEAPRGVPMTFNLTVAGTKAAKTDWANGDVVYVFFKGLEEKYLSLTYDGSKWTTTSGGDTLTDTDFNGLTTKTLTAVHLPVAVDVAFADGAFVFTKGGNPVYNYYLYQTGKEYTVDGTTVTASLEMGKPAGIAQFHVAGITDYAELYSFSSSEIRPVACSGVTVDGSVVEKAKPAGDQLWGVDDADGLVFGGRLENPGAVAEYKFILTGPEKILKLERSKKVLNEGARYNFPVPEEWTVVVNNPGYDFLHLSHYTFNTQFEFTTETFVQKRAFEDNDGSVDWWTKVNPSYYVVTDPTPESVSYRHALAKYDAHYVNLAELAFNVVDVDDEIMDDEAIAAANLSVEFTYADPELGAESLPDLSKTESFLKYSDLWVDNTVFYYRTNEKKFIPVVGKLFITVAGEKYELPTRFSRPKKSVKYPEVMLDYSHYALIRWTPFEAPTATGFTIVLDENKYYREPLFKGLNLVDNRPNTASYFVIEDGAWVEGNVMSYDPLSSTPPTDGNGYLNGVLSRDAYQIKLSESFSNEGVPNEVRRLLSVQYSADGVNFVNEQDEAGTLTPYVVYDYRSEVQFSGFFTIPVTVTIESPWQEPLSVEYVVTIKGIN